MRENLLHGALDRKILTEPWLDDRPTVTELAHRLRLTASPCHRRLRDRERKGAVRLRMIRRSRSRTRSVRAWWPGSRGR
ncbi:winged helix-turn-helix transcriptional regulator [Streptomyces sp. NPDC008222]|uniref:winged helix-turn-helix transcriptional regulator n=1 Tax=Streptomyces sp. NPDC008222 TaxID=3364820 RepID=UPI0036E018B9